MVSAALGTVLALLSVVGIVIAALTISPWFALLLLKAKALKFFLALAVGAVLLGGRALRARREKRPRSEFPRPLSVFTNRKPLAWSLMTKHSVPLMRLMRYPSVPSALVRPNHFQMCRI